MMDSKRDVQAHGENNISPDSDGFKTYCRL